MKQHTRRNRDRKHRINEHQRRAVLRQIKQIEAMTDDHKATIHKLMVAGARGEPLTTTSIANWHDLREMGVVREKDGKLVLTSVGMQLASDK
jgi:hypothetical protein